MIPSGFPAAVLVVVLACSCVPSTSGGSTGRAEDPTPAASVPVRDPERSRRERSIEISASLTVEEACGQLIMTGIGGRGVLDQASRLLLTEVPVGAVVLFGFNVPEEASDITAALGQAQDTARGSGAGVPLFVAIDHEGGEVFRFKRGVTVLPSARSLGEQGPEVVARSGATAGRELRSLGISLNLAPVVESWDPRNGGFLKTRTYSSDPRESGLLASAFLKAQQAEGTAATAKHYPGNGSADPHSALPVVNVPLEEIAERYEIPFRAVIEAGVSAVMLSHARFPALDPQEPASLSPSVIGRLKNDLGFRGVVLTDDLSMKALSGEGGVGKAAVRAVRAGADMVMSSGGRGAREAYLAILEAVRDGSLPEARVRDAAARVVEQKLRFGVLKDEIRAP